MTDFGLALSSEEHPPNDLVRLARRAEETGFESYAGFYKAFRRAFGISPEECRRRAAELPHA